MAALRLLINGATVYEGPSISVPHVGDDIHHDGEVVRIEAVVWDFGASDVVSVTLLVGGQPYTF